MFNWGKRLAGTLGGTGEVVENVNRAEPLGVHPETPKSPLIRKPLYSADPEAVRHDEMIARRCSVGGTIGSEVPTALAIDTGNYAPVASRRLIDEMRAADAAAAETARDREESISHGKIAKAWDEVKDAEALPRSVLALNAPAPQLSEAEWTRRAKLAFHENITPQQQHIWPVMRKPRAVTA